MAETYAKYLFITLGLLLLSPDALLAQGSPVIASNKVNSCVGEITISVTSGTSPYTYRWEDGSGNDIGQNTRQISNLSPDDYTVIVTDASGRTTTETYTITDPPDLLGNLIVTDVLCKGDRTGSVEIEMTNGNPDYEWELFGSTGVRHQGSTGGLEINVLGLPADNYRFTVLDSDGCTGEFNFTISEPAEALEINVLQQDNPLCNGSSDGRISIEATGGTVGAGGYTYKWVDKRFPGTEIGDEAIINGLPSGEYRIRVTDDNGCSEFVELELNDPAELLIDDASLGKVSCAGGSDGTISLTVSGGTGDLTYSWSNGDTTKDITGLSAGDYTVTVTDDNGCSIQEIYTVSEPSSITVSETISNVDCRGENSGSISLSVSGGTGAYSYLWNDGITSRNRSNIPAGSYEVTIKDANNCEISETYNITEPADGLSLDDTNKQNPKCVGGSDGSLSVDIIGGVMPYTYSWNTGANTQGISNVEAGSYEVTVTDANGCTLTINTTLDDPDPITANPTVIAPSCNQDSDGSITLNPQNGTGPYTYLWSDNQTTSRIENLSAGVYSVRITDSNGCEINQNITVNEPDVIQANATVTNVSCNGFNDGSIELGPIGGTGAFTYLWDDGTTQNSISNLAPGNYSVQITDANGCSLSQNFNIVEPDALSLASSKIDVLCFGDATGSVDVTIQGGTAPYSFNWSNGTNQEDANNLIAGTYSLQVTDSNGCTISESFTIEEPTEALDSDIDVSEIDCSGNSKGAIEVTAKGGVAPYTYLWNTGSSQNRIENISEGNYTVTITDNNGCQVTEVINLTAPAQLQDNAVVNNVSCKGAGDASIQLNVSGGTGTYSYQWDSGANTASLSGLNPGNYSVEITDSNGCTIRETYNITEPDILELSVSNSDVLCFGQATAEAITTVTGGTQPYTYSWSNGETSSDLSNITAGNYNVIVTDANGCSVSESFEVNQPDDPIRINETILDVACSGDQTGSISVEVSGGSGGFSYLWSNGSTADKIEGLSPGRYQLTVTDSNGCSVVEEYEVIAPNPLILNGNVTNILCSGETTGAIDLTISGGVAPYDITWSDGSRTEDLSNMSAGNYTVTLEDANGCSTTANYTITEPSQIVVDPDVTGVTCFGQNDGSIEVSISGGVGPYDLQWSNGSSSNILNNLSGGHYSLIVTDNNGCRIEETIEVPAPTAPLGASASTSGIACTGQESGSIVLDVTGGTAPYSYVWSNNSRLKDLRNVPPGSYEVTITDANQCTFSASYLIDEAEPISASVTSLEPTCINDSNGQIELEVRGGTAPYTFEWSNNSTSQDQYNLPIGQYTVIIRDANNCTYTESVDLGSSRGLDVQVDKRDVQCKGDSNGAINLSVSGGTGNFTYQWQSGETEKSIEGLDAGVYRCIITDDQGCDNSITVVVSEPSLDLSASVDFTSKLACFNSEEGYARAMPVGGTAPYEYLWSTNDTTREIRELSSGSYSVLITDANDCTVQNTFLIDEPESALGIDITGKLELDCIGDNDGSISLRPFGGEGPYEILWNDGTSIRQKSNLPAGDYLVRVSDNLGCQIEQIIKIEDPNPIQIFDVEVKDTECYNDRNGSISIDVRGGNAPYTYLWSNGATTQDITGLSNGSYGVQVTDSNGCTFEQTFDLNNAPLFQLDPNVSPISCPGANDASISLNIQGGTGPYDITWSQGGDGSVISNLSPGTYEVFITDNNGCNTSARFIIVDPSPLSATSNKLDALDCNQPASGSIVVSPSGGSPPYSYLWSNGETTPSISNLDQGEYGLIITDRFGCTYSETFRIQRPEQIEVNIESELIINCEDQSVSALVTADVSGGVTDYRYSWNKSASEENFAVIDEPGKVILTVTDRRGCVEVAEIDLNFPEFSNAQFAYTSESLERDQILAISDSIYFQDLSGSGSVDWSWEFGDEFNSTEQNPSHLYVAEGNYPVTLFTTDEAGCQTETTILLSIEQGYRVIIPSAFTPDGDGLNDFFQAKFLGIESYRLSVFSKSGEIVFTTTDLESRGWDGRVDGQEGLNGQYVYKFSAMSFNGQQIERTGTFALVK